jgi:hypothetical protein
MSDKDNIVVSTEREVDLTGSEQPVAPEQPQQMKLTDVPITNENVSLNVMISFLNIAQKRGAFAFDESAKIWECIQVFVKANAASQTA